jgi:hypothetical protein
MTKFGWVLNFGGDQSAIEIGRCVKMAVIVVPLK